MSQKFFKKNICPKHYGAHSIARDQWAKYWTQNKVLELYICVIEYVCLTTLLMVDY